jgi:hypothetical protein
MQLTARRRVLWPRKWAIAILPMLLVTMQPTVAAVQTSATKGVAEFTELVQFFSGKWHCAGHFANGKPIASDESFGALLGGAWLQQIHDDEPPMGYHAYSNWGVDRKSGALVVAILDSAGGLRLFGSKDWTPQTIVLVSDQTAAPERFTYNRKSATAFDVQYEVETKTGDWKPGDQLNCERQV